MAGVGGAVGEVGGYGLAIRGLDEIGEGFGFADIEAFGEQGAQAGAVDAVEVVHFYDAEGFAGGAIEERELLAIARLVIGDRLAWRAGAPINDREEDF